MRFFKSAFLIVFFLPIFIAIGCSDNGSDSTDEIPANLVDTWWYVSGTMNGVPIPSYSEVSHNDLATTSSLTFGADGTWSSYEYTAPPTPIFSQSGTFTVSGNTLNIRRTMYDGVPEDPVEEYTSQFLVSGDNLTITSTEEIMGETFTLVVYYLREGSI